MRMSIVTSVLDKLEFIGTIQLKIGSFVPKLNAVRSGMLQGGREWFSILAAEEFQRKGMTQRALNEMQSRLPRVR